jgi:hypothetical protein
MVNGTIIAMEVKQSLEGEIQEGQLEDLNLMEIQQLIRDNKINDFLRTVMVPYGWGNRYVFLIGSTSKS